jgi:hypothetical protein
MCHKPGEKIHNRTHAIIKLPNQRNASDRKLACNVVRQKSNGVEIRARACQFELTSDDVADTDDDDDIVGAAS